MPKKLTALSSDDITNFFKGNKSFGGCLANDQLVKPDPTKVYILNLQNANQAGSHWTVYCNGYYADSYGEPPTSHIQKFTHTYNHEDFQGLYAESCGYFCLYIAMNLLHGLPPTEHLIPNAPIHNEHLLQHYFAN